MSYANVEKLAEIAGSNHAMLERLACADTDDRFVDTAIELGVEHGLTFSRGDATAWIADNLQLRGGNELSDAQLEAVAGGKNFQEAFRNMFERHFASIQPPQTPTAPQSTPSVDGHPSLQPAKEGGKAVQDLLNDPLGFKI